MKDFFRRNAWERPIRSGISCEAKLAAIRVTTLRQRSGSIRAMFQPWAHTQSISASPGSRPCCATKSPSAKWCVSRSRSQPGMSPSTPWFASAIPSAAALNSWKRLPNQRSLHAHAASRPCRSLDQDSLGEKFRAASVFARKLILFRRVKMKRCDPSASSFSSLPRGPLSHSRILPPQLRLNPSLPASDRISPRTPAAGFLPSRCAN